jgi:putative SOS response-associated peptidase YedK
MATPSRREEWRSPAGERLQTFATITTDANELLAPIQDRMPVIIENGDWPVWLGEAEGDPVALLRPEGGQRRNDGPELIQPIAEPEPNAGLEAAAISFLTCSIA